MTDQGILSPEKASGEPTLDPMDYDFEVAHKAEILKRNLERMENIQRDLKRTLEKSLQIATLGLKYSTEDQQQKRASYFREGSNAQAELVDVNGEVEEAFKAASAHYHKNEDKYVENAAQTRRAFEENEEAMKQADDIPF